MRGQESAIYLYASILDSCISSKNVQRVGQAHAQAITRDIFHHHHIRAKLVSAYASCGQSREANIIFSFTHRRTPSLYKSIIRGYASNNLFSLSLAYFRLMLYEGNSIIDRFTLPTVIKSCAALSALSLGKQVHGVVLVNGLASDLAHSNSLMSMYGKFGEYGEVKKVFDGMPVRSKTTWTAVMAGCGKGWDVSEVLVLFERMLEEGVRVDDKCLTVVLNACSHGGMVEKGKEIFETMEARFGIKPGLVHYTCVVDMLARSGRLEEAERLVMRMEMEPDEAVYNALLSGCRIHRNVEVAERIANKAYKRRFVCDVGSNTLNCVVKFQLGSSQALQNGVEVGKGF